MLVSNDREHHLKGIPQVTSAKLLAGKWHFFPLEIGLIGVKLELMYWAVTSMTVFCSCCFLLFSSKKGRDCIKYTWCQ